MAQYTVRISARSCCGKHRWPLLDMVETLSNSGFQHVMLQTIAFAGQETNLALPVDPGISRDSAHALVDLILHRLSQSLGGNAACFTGNLVATALVEADATQARDSLPLITGRGLHADMEPAPVHIAV